MSTLLDNFRICDTIDTTIRNKIKLFHVFDDWNNGNNILFITNNDTVYGLGGNGYGCLGFGHHFDVETPLIIRELCGQRIQQFINGNDFVLAMNEDNHVFSWGHNHRGQCARDVTPSNVYLKPQLISQLNDKNIAYICCGVFHSLALTTDGKVYGWGDNTWGQIGCGDFENDIMCPPVLIQFENNYKMKNIFCDDYSSFTITLNGLVLSWGYNRDHHCGHQSPENILTPKLIPQLNHIKSICSVNTTEDNRFTCFLSNSNIIYFCGKYTDDMKQVQIEILPRPISMKLNVQQIEERHSFVPRNIVLIQTDDTICELFSPNKVKKYKYNNFIDFYATELQQSYNTLHINMNMVTNLSESVMKTNKTPNIKPKQYNTNTNEGILLFVFI